MMDLPEQLQTARRGLPEIQEYRILNDFTWHYSLGKWVLHFQLVCNILGHDNIPAASTWYAIVSPSYPLGEIKISPAQSGGITKTFQHQKYNGEQKGLPWRKGEVCVNTSLLRWGRKDYTEEPFEPSARLKWYIQRTVEWLYGAAANHLSTNGDPFELPPLPKEGADHIVFNEDAFTFDLWSKISVPAGLFKFRKISSINTVCIIDEYDTIEGKITYQWGEYITSEHSMEQYGIWLMLKKVPVIEPWQIPTTWDQLFAVAKEQGAVIDKYLFETYVKCNYTIKCVNVGFPIPFLVGMETSRIHWFPINLPEPPTKNGFSNPADYKKHAAKTLFAAGREIVWVSSENWNTEQISARGRLTPLLQNSKIVIIGAGVVGSLFSELLVRLGCHYINCIDDDIFHAGNLSRHILTMNSIRKPKAEELAKRLNTLSPSSNITYSNHSLQDTLDKESKIFENADLVVDATGDDEVISILSNHLSSTSKIFISLSIGLVAKRLFCYVSRNNNKDIEEDFRSKITPWIFLEKEENHSLILPRDGIGCWHPIFPSRLDDIGMMLGAVTKPIEQLLKSNSISNLIIVEKTFNPDNIFSGLRISHG